MQLKGSNENLQSFVTYLSQTLDATRINFHTEEIVDVDEENPDFISNLDFQRLGKVDHQLLISEAKRFNLNALKITSSHSF